MRILLVEDEPKLAMFIKRGLEAERYAVDVTFDGKDGFEFATTYCYDLVILDLVLPRLNGDEVLRGLRRTNGLVPVLIVTSRDATEEKVRLFELGADDYLTKPFAFAELLYRSRALLRRKQLKCPSRFQVGDLELDGDARQVKRGARLVDLTGREFSLLKYLMENESRILTRSMIMDRVWGQTFEGATNIVDVYMRQLRRKVDQGNDLKMIQTIRGAGYCIRECGQSSFF